MRFPTSPWRISGIAGLLFVVLSLVASRHERSTTELRPGPSGVRGLVR